MQEYIEEFHKAQAERYREYLEFRRTNPNVCPYCRVTELHIVPAYVARVYSTITRCCTYCAHPVYDSELVEGA